MCFVLSIRKTIRTVQKEFNHTVFVELFMAQFGKKFKVLSQNMCAIKILQHYGHVGLKKMSHSFLTHFLHGKLHLMLNENIPKDGARSGLSYYIY